MQKVFAKSGLGFYWVLGGEAMKDWKGLLALFGSKNSRIVFICLIGKAYSYGWKFQRLGANCKIEEKTKLLKWTMDHGEWKDWVAVKILESWL